ADSFGLKLRALVLRRLGLGRDREFWHNWKLLDLSIYSLCVGHGWIFNLWGSAPAT
ncbi:hypothetical protein L916_01243, partial [Phytophthora nicotianae]